MAWFPRAGAGFERPAVEVELFVTRLCVQAVECGRIARPSAAVAEVGEVGYRRERLVVGRDGDVQLAGYGELVGR